MPQLLCTIGGHPGILSAFHIVILLNESFNYFTSEDSSMQARMKKYPLSQQQIQQRLAAEQIGQSVEDLRQSGWVGGDGIDR